MRIAFIAPFGLQPKGTVSARMVPLARAISRRGHFVRIVIPPWDDPEAVDSERPGHRVSTVRGSGSISGLLDLVTLPLPRRLPYSIGLTAGLVREALKLRPHVVHVFKPVGYSGLAGLVLSLRRVPWVLDTDDWEGPGGWADINPYSTAQRTAVTMQEVLLPRVARAVTAASRTLEVRAWDFGLPRQKVFYLPNGVESEIISKVMATPQSTTRERIAELRRKHALEDREVLLLYTRFAEFPWRWPLDILERVAADRPHAVLLVVGSGFFGEERVFETEAARRGLDANLRVVGWVPNEDVWDYLALGDAALYPMQDTLLNRAKSPVKVLEPMAAGLPIVAHRVGQAAEFIGETGVLVEPGDIEGMADAAVALLADPARRTKLGKLAHKRVAKHFNWDSLAETAEQAYNLARTGRKNQVVY